MFRRFPRHLCLRTVVVVMLAMLTSLFAPSATVWAKSYTIDQVNIDATVNTDGSLDVQESRTFDFDGLFHGVYWKIPQGDYNGRNVEVQIAQVGEMVGGTFVPFSEGYSELDGTYELSDYGSYIKLKLFSTHEDEDATFVIAYRDTNLVARHEDVAELYWKFVSDGWDEESRNVTCTVHLPVPEGKAVEPEENVRAWGHGPLDATVHFQGNDVLYQVPGVGTSEFAEARITFPEGWLSAADQISGRALPSILDEEQQWADEANARRERARMVTYGGGAGIGIATLLTIVGSLYAMAAYRRTHRAQFDDKYFRDVPSDDHPAVLGALYRGGSPADEDFTATLMRLTDLRAVHLELVTIESKGFLGRTKSQQDYRLTLLPQAADMQLDPIDRSALHTLFKRIGRYAPQRGAQQEGMQSVCFSDLETIGKKHPESFHDAYENWQAKVQAQVAQRQFFKSRVKTGRGLLSLIIVLLALLFMASVLMLIFTEAWQIFVPLILLQMASFALCIVGIVRCRNISPEAIELRAKLEALRRWLTDFTRLEEAVPRDVVLWNRLLVMAVVLGVADEVIKQLKMTMPEILEDPMMRPTYGWYYVGPHGSPYRSFQSNYGSAHDVSTAKIAASESSSGGGGGGGFSGGGGGGFGGGGGGGAF